MKLFLFILASVFIHLSLLMFVPNYFAVTKLKIFPIELVEPRQLYLEPFLKRIEEGEGQKEKKSIKEFLVEDRRRREDFLMSKLRDLSLGESIDVPSPFFLVPQQKEEVTPEEKVRLLRSSPFFKDLSRLFQESSRPMGDYRGKELSVGKIEIPRRRILEDEGTNRIIARIMVPTKSKKPRSQGLKKDAIGIKGPAGKRKVLYKPETPEVKIDKEGEIELKFWVLPDGSVGSVFPLLRGDAELERIAVNYIKQWRFNPLDEGGRMVEQWGTITVKFRLK
ncbi:MAG: energy transducer TonB [Syntrophobacterales bacterium]|nr:MAG: energy transducer TonB [Syntrophobacterales bacterium]